MLRRAAEVLRDEGIKSLWKILSEPESRIKLRTKPPGVPSAVVSPAYWDNVQQGFGNKPHYLDAFLGALKRRAHLELIQRWGGIPETGRMLKTDLFEEAAGPDAFLGDLWASGRVVIGMDVSPAIVRKTQRRGESEYLRYVAADTRCLPFAEDSFALIVSPSTLDHFPDPRDLGRSLCELARVLAPDGRLIITVDNRQNIFDPLLRLAHRLGWVPYYLGRSYRVGELCAELEAAGFVVQETTAILHNPRLMAVAAVALAKRLDWPLLTTLVQRSLLAAQQLEHTRWKYFTGSFVAAKAVRKGHSQVEGDPGEKC
jgi:SAM-dependent methyltransferase